MIEVVGNLWDYDADAKVILTNGVVKHTGHAVMGRGIAREAKEKFSNLDLYLGQKIKRDGSHVAWVGKEMLSTMATNTLPEDAPAIHVDYALVFYPTKHHWRDQADLTLIERSAQELLALTERLGWEKVVLPRPGCGNGRLNWGMVKPVIDFLDERFVVINFESI